MKYIITESRLENLVFNFLDTELSEFETMESYKTAKQSFDWVRVSGFAAAYVVHDGRLEPKEEVVKDEEVEALSEVIEEKVKAAVNKEARKQRIRKSLQNTVK
jgi:hypothetical protein